jgi:hypothetical protein
MKLARYWTRDRAEVIDPEGNPVRAVARGWSDESIAAAGARAREIAQRVAERIASRPGERNQYQYGDRPLPEPVIHEFGSAAVVTRNAYGALVLNADHLMFVDVDREDPKPSAGADTVLSGIFSLFGKSAPPAPKAADTVLDSIQRVAQRHDFSARVYKTKGGYRVLITSAGFQAGNQETEALLNEFGSDPLYKRLCRMQESFRARLTPKPWRCGFHKPPVEFPLETPQDEDRYRRWEMEYNSKAAPFATCHYVTAFGKGSVLPEFEELIRHHDQETKAGSDLPLA